MKLTPVYHKENPTYRVVYRPHNRWFAQRLTEAKPTREHDPWQDIGKAKATRDEAMALMYRYAPLKP